MDTDWSTVARALSFAARAHVGQHRKDGATPYFAHLARVVGVLSHVFGIRDPLILTVGALHDTIEDTTTDYDDLLEEFGESVADAVAAMSKDKRLREDSREDDYRRAIIEAPLEVRLVKLADVFDNLTDSVHLPPTAQRKTIRQARGWIELIGPTLPADATDALTHLQSLLTTIDTTN